MRVFAISVATAIVFALVAMYVLDKNWQQSADQAFSSPTSVRFPHEENSRNLVGKDWFSAKGHQQEG